MAPRRRRLRRGRGARRGARRVPVRHLGPAVRGRLLGRRARQGHQAPRPGGRGPGRDGPPRGRRPGRVPPGPLRRHRDPALRRHRSGQGRARLRHRALLHRRGALPARRQGRRPDVLPAAGHRRARQRVLPALARAPDRAVARAPRSDRRRRLAGRARPGAGRPARRVGALRPRQVRLLARPLRRGPALVRRGPRRQRPRVPGRLPDRDDLRLAEGPGQGDPDLRRHHPEGAQAARRPPRHRAVAARARPPLLRARPAVEGDRRLPAHRPQERPVRRRALRGRLGLRQGQAVRPRRCARSSCSR